MAAYQAGNDSVTAAAQAILSDVAVSAFLSLPDSFQAGGLDAALVTCSVIYQAGPPSLANFASGGTGNEALVDQLLATPLLMRDMLVAGGATSLPNRRGFDKKFGEAMAIFTKILKASAVLDYDEVMAAYRESTFAAASNSTPWDDFSVANVLKRLAVATACAHAVPVMHRYCRSLPADDCYVDPVARYMHFEKHYHAGDLDPAFPVLTAFELFHAVDSDATDDDMMWLRSTLVRFRPDHVAMYGARLPAEIYTRGCHWITRMFA